MFFQARGLPSVLWTGCRRSFPLVLLPRTRYPPEKSAPDTRFVKKCFPPWMGNLTSSPPGGLSSTACLQYVQDVVSQNCVVIFSKSTCPYCKMAKNIFNEIGATYKVIELDEHNDGRRLQEALAHMTGARTVPRVFVNGHCIGGGSDTRQLHQQGKLVPLIEQCAPCCAATSSEGSGDRQFESAK